MYTYCETAISQFHSCYAPPRSRGVVFFGRKPRKGPSLRCTPTVKLLYRRLRPKSRTMLVDHSESPNPALGLQYGDSLSIAANSAARPPGSPRPFILGRSGQSAYQADVLVRLRNLPYPAGTRSPPPLSMRCTSLHDPLEANPETSASGRARDAQTPAGILLDKGCPHIASRFFCLFRCRMSAEGYE